MADTILLGVRLEAETHRNFKLWCVRRGVNMSDVVRRLVETWIAEQERLENNPDSEKERKG